MMQALALAVMLMGVPEDTCPESVRAVLAAPRESFGESRQAAIEGSGLGTPRRITVAVAESRHDLGDGKFLPRVHYRLKYQHLELQYGQAAAGGREILEEVALRGPEPRLELPFAMGAALPEVRRIVGSPTDAGRLFLRYSCSNGVTADEVRFQFSLSDGGLFEVTWMYPVD